MMFTSEKHRISSTMYLVNYPSHLEHGRVPVKQFLGCFVILRVSNADGEDVSLPVAGDGPKLFVELLEEGQDAPSHVDVAQVAVELPESFCQTRDPPTLFCVSGKNEENQKSQECE